MGVNLSPAELCEALNEIFHHAFSLVINILLVIPIGLVARDVDTEHRLSKDAVLAGG